MKSKRMTYNAITELRGVKRIVGGGIRKEREARRNSERGGGQAEGGGMFAIMIELCMSNILADFTPLSSRGKRRRRLAAQAAEPCGNMAFAHIFKQVYVGNSSLPEMTLCRKSPPFFSSSASTKKMRTLTGSHFSAVAEEEGFVRSARRDGIASEEEGKRKEEGCSP